VPWEKRAIFKARWWLTPDENDITDSEQCAAHSGSGLEPEKMDMPGGPCMSVRVANYVN
jgi:hypothetical protein